MPNSSLPPSHRKPGRPVAGNAEETRRRVQNAALRHFGTHGYTQTTVKAVARDAGLTSAAVYHYAPSKRDLFVALASDAIDLAVAPLKKVARTHKTFAGRLNAVFRQMLVTDEAHPDLARFIVVLTGDAARYPELRDAYEAVLQEYTELCATLVADAQDAKEMSAGADPAGVTQMLAGTILGITSLLASTPQAQHASIVGCAEVLFSGRLFREPRSPGVRRRTGDRQS
jgi:AcrR family transcriptional regulator